MELLTEIFWQCTLFFFFFLPPAPLILVKWRSQTRAKVCTNTGAGWRLVCQVPASCDFHFFFFKRGWVMYQTKSTRFIMDTLTEPYLWCLLPLPGSAFTFSWRCWLPTADFQTSCCNNLIMFFVSFNGLGLALLLADVTVWDRAPFPWHQP